MQKYQFSLLGIIGILINRLTTNSIYNNRLYRNCFFRLLILLFCVYQSYFSLSGTAKCQIRDSKTNYTNESLLVTPPSTL